MNLSFANLLARRVRISCVEAVALAGAAAEALESNPTLGPYRVLAPAQHIFLSSDGRVIVSLARVAENEAEATHALGRLLQQLLRLDDDGGQLRDTPIPGALMVLIARALGEIALPPPSYSMFRATLATYSVPQPVMLAAVYWRAAKHRRVEVSSPPSVPQRIRVRRHHPRAATNTPTGRRRISGTASMTVPLSVMRAAGAAVAVALLTAPLTNRAPVELPTAPAISRASLLPSLTALEPVAVAAAPAPLPIGSRSAGDLFSPSFSGAGDVVFHAGRHPAALMRASLTGSGVQSLLRDRAANYHAAPSPDGRWLAFDSDRDGTRGVYVARADLTAARRISGSGYAAVPTWSPDGRMLAFARAEAANPRVWNVWVADAATGRLARVTHHRIGQVWGASWFPDGRHLAYSAEDHLFVIDLRTRAVREFASPVRARALRTPAVSPDGTRIIFQVRHDGVWLLDVRSGRMTRLIDDATAEEFAWSPRGDAVVYHARHDERWSLWRLRLR